MKHIAFDHGVCNLHRAENEKNETYYTRHGHHILVFKHGSELLYVEMHGKLLHTTYVGIPAVPKNIKGYEEMWPLYHMQSQCDALFSFSPFMHQHLLRAHSLWNLGALVALTTEWFVSISNVMFFNCVFCKFYLFFFNASLRSLGQLGSWAAVATSSYLRCNPLVCFPMYQPHVHRRESPQDTDFVNGFRNLNMKMKFN